MTWALKDAASLAGSFFESEQTLPRRMSLMDTFFTLKPTLSPRRDQRWTILSRRVVMV